MNKLSNVGKVFIVAVAAVVLIVLVIVYGMGNNNSTQTVEVNSSTTSGVANATSGIPSTGGAKSSATTPSTNYRLPANLTIRFVTPVVNDLWTIGTDNPIVWDKVGNITGSLSLIDAATGGAVGVILPSVGPQQTSFTWNVRDVFLNETSPLKKDVVPGAYEIRLTYNGNGIPPITSPKFTIVASSSAR